MRFDPDKPHRRSIRLQDYDYSRAGAYFITICTICAQNRECLFGEVVEDVMHPTALGQVVAEEWTRSSEIRPEIELDEWVVMPNHLHGIIVITSTVGAHGCAPDLRPHDRASPRRQPRSLSSFVAGFKATSTKRINELRRTPCLQLWQRNYYEHIIRSEDELNRVRAYIVENPARWALDRENPANAGTRAGG